MAGQKLKFPVDWEFRIITEQQCHPEIIAELNMVLRKFEVVNPVSTGRQSTSGNYRTCHVKVTFPNREYMQSLGEALTKVPGVKMVL